MIISVAGVIGSGLKRSNFTEMAYGSWMDGAR